MFRQRRETAKQTANQNRGSHLQHLVGAGLDAGNEVGGAEGRLLHFGEVVLRVSVEREAAERDQRVVALRPHLRGGHWCLILTLVSVVLAEK